MYACKYCGADLHFDIELQKLKCDACEQTASVYETVKETDGIQDEYRLNLFECPQCGGQLLSDDTSITQYCSFCGGMTILSSRIADEKMPKEIIPFQMTKEACHKAYKRYMKKKFYAPKAFRDCKGEQDFRAIYIPYWKFHETQEEIASFEAVEKKGTSKAIVKYNANFDVAYDNIIFDASSSFADQLGDAIAPFDAEGLKPFTPSYLCGFYADTADVPADTYMESAKTAADEKTVDYIQQHLKKNHSGSKVIKEGKQSFGTKSDEGSRLLLPAWFLAYRRGNRVAYATVNGQTGKVEADLPVDLKKFGLATAGIAIFLFIILNLFFTFKPGTTMVMTSVLLTLIMKLYADEMMAVFYRDHKLSDLGFAYQFRDLYRQAKDDETKIQAAKMKGGKIFSTMLRWGLWIIVAASSINLPLGLVILFGGVYFLFAHVGPIFLWAAATIVTLGYIYQGFLYIRKTKSLKGIGAIFALIAVIISGAVIVINPVSDLYYYLGIFATLLAVLASALDLIHCVNIASTRPLPEFMRQRGGEEEW